MKRSRLFLGLTTCCLAIAGVVAAKTTHFGSEQAYLTTAGVCDPTLITTTCDKATAGAVCRTSNLTGARTYFTQVVLGQCVHPLIYDAD